jgi:hypothetical protein
MIMLADDPRSKSGRKLTPIPRKKLSPRGRNYNAICKLWYEWMIENAREEMKDCSYSQTMIDAININNMSTSDGDTLNIMLFDEIHVKIKY